MQNYWKQKLTPFDISLCHMVQSMTQMPCEPKNGGNHFFFEADYTKYHDPDFIAALWDAIAGRAGSRLINIRDDSERQTLLARIKFDKDRNPENAFVPVLESPEDVDPNITRKSGNV